MLNVPSQQNRGFNLALPSQVKARRINIQAPCSLKTLDAASAFFGTYDLRDVNQVTV
jgi:hypothetical protein